MEFNKDISFGLLRTIPVLVLVALLLVKLVYSILKLFTQHRVSGRVYRRESHSYYHSSIMPLAMATIRPTRFPTASSSVLIAYSGLSKLTKATICFFIFRISSGSLATPWKPALCSTPCMPPSTLETWRLSFTHTLQVGTGA